MSRAKTPRSLLQLSGVIVDVVYRVQSVPKAGEEALVHGSSIHPGGGFNAMIAASRAGMDVTYGGGIGDGPLGYMVKAALDEAAITIARAPVLGADQGCSTVLIDDDAERTLIAQEGAEGRLSADDLRWIAPGQFDHWLLSGYQLSYARSQAALTAWLTGLDDTPPLIFDPSPAVGQIHEPALKLIMAKALWISANQSEATVLSGFVEPERATYALARQRQRPDGGVIVRASANGCYVAMSNGPVHHLAGYAVDSVDTNGAGDTHIGSFLGALAQGLDVLDALRYANIAAALSTTINGPATAPEHTKVLSLLTNHR